MKLFYFTGPGGITNFGDELNRYLWPPLLPGLLDDNEETQFVGIGTLLNDRLPAASRTVIFGTGVGYYGPPRPDRTWEIHCVRGPLSAQALGLSASLAVTDPAALIKRLPPPAAVPAPRSARAFMPHWQSEPDGWKRACDATGIEFVDPRWPPERIIDAIRRTDVLITEAMHGAIVADALRTPWVAVRTCDAIKAFKWNDWCQSMALEYRPVLLPTIWPRLSSAGPIRRARRWARLKWISMALRRVAERGRPILSGADVLESRVDELEERLQRLRGAESFTRVAAQTRGRDTVSSS